MKDNIHMDFILKFFKMQLQQWCYYPSKKTPSREAQRANFALKWLTVVDTHLIWLIHFSFSWTLELLHRRSFVDFVPRLFCWSLTKKGSSHSTAWRTDHHGIMEELSHQHPELRQCSHTMAMWVLRYSRLEKMFLTHEFLTECWKKVRVNGESNIK